MRKHYPLNSGGVEDAGQLPWIDGVPETDTEGSYPGHALFTDMEAELLNLQGAAGFVQSSSDLTQALQAVARGGIYLGPLGGTANALAGTIQGSVVLPSLQKGVRLIGYPTSANTSATVTLAVTGIGAAGTTVTFPVNKPDGTPLVAGDIKIGRRYEFEADGAGNVIISGGGIGVNAGIPASAHARVNTNTGGGAVAIAGSTNVSSITRGTVAYSNQTMNTITVNFITPMNNANYSILITGGIDSVGPSGAYAFVYGTLTTTSFTILMLGQSSGVYADQQTNLSFAVFQNP